MNLSMCQKRKRVVIITISMIVFILLIGAIIKSRADENVVVKYRAHVAYNGWMPWQVDGTTAGTVGESRRIEALKIKLEGTSDGSVVYQVFVRGDGWQNEVRNSETAGTEGQSKQIEAVKVRLEGKVAENYDITYRVHVKNKGWLEWVSNGAMAGSDTEGLRIEAIEIKLVKKESNTTGYQVNVENTRGIVTKLNEEEYKIFVSIIFAESGAEPYEAKLGVANVILNRMYDSRYPNNLKGVVYQKSQFTPASNGILSKRIADYNAGKFTTKNHIECIKAADEALAGKNNCGNRIGFMTPAALEKYMAGKYTDKWVVSNTAFFNTK